MVQRRAKYEPLQYITGKVDFFGIELTVTSGVLIPRPETEELVEYILDSHNDDAPKRLVDIGTGSGCIALAIKKQRPKWEVWATDLSEFCTTSRPTKWKRARITGALVPRRCICTRVTTPLP